MNFIFIDQFNIYDEITNITSYLLIIENKKLLYSFLSDLNNYCIYEEFIKILDEKDKQLKCSDYIEFIPSLFNLDINNKKNINALLRKIKNFNFDMISFSLEKIKNELNLLFKKIKISFPIEMLSNIAISEDDLLKIINITIDDKAPSILERIMLFVKLTFELRNITIFIFYELTSFLTEKEIDLLLHDCSYLGIKIINIENRNIENFSFSKKMIIDDDYCLIK